MLKPFLLIPSTKIISAFALILLVSSSQSDCSSNTKPPIGGIFEPNDTIGSCFTQQQNGHLALPQSYYVEHSLTVTGNKYHF